MDEQVLSYRDKKGFTLVELLVVVAILTILMAVGYAAYGGVSVKAQDSKKKAEVDNIAKVWEMQYDQAVKQYPLKNSLDDFSDADFTSGEKPNADNYKVSMSPNNKSFVVCTTLSNNTNYCRTSALGPLAPTPVMGLDGGGSSTPTPTSIPGVTPTPTTPAATSTPIPPTPTNSPTPTPRPFKYVFVTSNAYNGSLGGAAGGGLAGADSICQGNASGAGLSGTYKAWLSDGATSATSRLTHSTLPYKLVNDTTIALHWSDLTDGLLTNPINLDANGSAVSYSSWTNTKDTGAIAGIDPVYDHCNNWQSASSASYGSAGQLNATSSLWTFFDSPRCNSLRSLYCFEQ